MRAKYYKLSIRQMKKEKSFAIFIILVIIFSSITTLYTQSIEPVLVQFTESNAYSLALNATEQAIRKNTQIVSYSNVISYINDENGKIVALQVNTNELNRISNDIAIDIEKNIEDVESSSIKIPIGLFFNTNIFGGAGIRVSIKTVPLGDTKIDCVSEFDSVGINQTRHRIVLKIKTYYTIIAPVYLKNECYEKDLILAETILNGDIPSSYANLDLTDKSQIIDIP